MPGDRRVKYTKMVLRDSLIKLLHDKPISRITVKELCEYADINRATFYAHYADQFDFLKQIETELITDINSYLDNFNIETGETDLLPMIFRILEYIEKNKELCRVLLGENGDMDFRTNIFHLLRDRVVFEWQKNRQVDDNTAEYIYTYVVTGSIGVISKWLLDQNPLPPQSMAEFVTCLVNQGIGFFIA